jgi:hypothetical protein
MAEGGESADGELPGIDYAALMRAAILDVVRQILARAAASGLPGDHHFLLSFGPAEDGVVIPQRLRKQFPDEMTIVLQHQFWGLEVDERGFSVTLRFGGAPERLVVPWSALRTFADPSVGFGLRLRPEEESVAAMAPEAGGVPGRAAAARPPEAKPSDRSGAHTSTPQPDKVIDFSSFRRKSADDEG